MFGFYEDEVTSCVSVFYIRGGAVVDKEDCLSGAERILDSETLSTFICEQYRMRTDIPATVLLSFPMEDAERETLSAYLSAPAGHRVTVRTPERGPARALCELAVSNAAERVRQFRRDAEQDEQSLVRLGELLSIGYPQRIEAYDISNIGSEHLTAGMVVLEDGRLARSEYASFNIRTVDGTDDYASMREALSRRLAHLDDADGSWTLADDPDYHLDASACNTMVTALASLNAKRQLTAQPGEDYGLADPAVTVTVTAAGETNRVFSECVEWIAAASKQGLGKMIGAFRRAIEAFRGLRYARSRRKPRVLVTGELLVNFHPGTNFHVEEYLDRSDMEDNLPRNTSQYHKAFQAANT